MTRVIDGTKLAAEIRRELAERIATFDGGSPCLATVLVGEDPASAVYVRMKHRACKKAGLRSIDVKLGPDTTQAELLAHVARLNADPDVNGILVQIPLPPQIDEPTIMAAIDPAKDVDGLTPVSVGNLVKNQPGMVACTPQGCIEILERNGVRIEGAHAVVIGRSEIVGKPVALLLLHRHATVTLCHSRTVDLPDQVRRADIVIAAVGRPELVRGDWIKPGAAVIDVGVNRVGDKLIGDVEFDGAAKHAGLITPVPGGVGPLTIAMLLANTLRAFEQQRSPA